MVVSTGNATFLNPFVQSGVSFTTGVANLGQPNSRSNNGLSSTVPFTNSFVTSSSTGVASFPQPVSSVFPVTGVRVTAPVLAVNRSPSPVVSQAVTPALNRMVSVPGTILSPSQGDRINMLRAYVGTASPNGQGIDVLSLRRQTGNRGLSALALGYGAEVKAAALEVLRNPGTTFANVTNRSRNAAALLPMMQFNNTATDKFLATMMVYKNGAYNGGVVGQYNLPQMVRWYNEFARRGQVSPLTQQAQQAAIRDERLGMGLFYIMMTKGLIDPNTEVDPRTGASRHGFWDAQFNGAYLNALRGITSGALISDATREFSGQGSQTVGKVDAFLNARQLPYVPDVLRPGFRL